MVNVGVLIKIVGGKRKQAHVQRGTDPNKL